MSTAIERRTAEVVAISELRRQLAQITTAEDALGVRERAEQMREAFKLMNKSVEECNEFAEIYIRATWKFGELVKDIPAHGNGSNQYARR